MAKQTLNIGSVANDGTGTNLRAGGSIINDNFNEIYTALGNGTTITLTATPTELNLLAGVTAIVTNSNSVALTNKTISGASNTLSNIGNSSLTNSSFSIRDDSSSAISIALGGTLKIKSNDGITTTVSQGDTINIQLDNTVVTSTSINTLSNKTIIASSNTISGLTNTNLSGSAGITNANLALPYIRFTDESSTQNSVALGGKLEFLAGEGINTIVGASSLTISAELATSANAGVATFNTASFTVNSGDVTIKSAGVSNAQLANSSVAIGTSTLTLGSAATTSIANLNLTGTSALSGSGTIDLTGAGNKVRFNFASTGARPSATTYQGAFAVVDSTAKAYFADSGGWNEIANENSSINLFTDVDLVTQAPADQQGLVWVSSSGKFVPGTGDLIKTAALIDVTNSGSGAYLFNSHYSGNNPTLYFRPGQTYAFRLNVTGHPFHLQTVAGGYSSGNAYTTGLTHVSLTGAVTTGASALLKVTGILYYEVPSNTSTSIFYACQFHSAMAGKIVIGNITETATGDGSTTTVTINSGRNVNDLLVFVNGICLEPTSDYTISGTTLTFVTAPVSAATITIRYL
jgi:hypothetical protein